MYVCTCVWGGNVFCSMVLVGRNAATDATYFKHRRRRLQTSASRQQPSPSRLAAADHSRTVLALTTLIGFCFVVPGLRLSRRESMALTGGFSVRPRFVVLGLEGFPDAGERGVDFWWTGLDFDLGTSTKITPANSKITICTSMNSRIKTWAGWACWSV
ncbi:hypothetical protein F4805DRAFT_65343 [Annulohypoxylon moriforme]|nr:hypothetical protein F4805DRAFT_65343 [Annulohypoxylon moriforme]